MDYLNDIFFYVSDILFTLMNNYYWGDKVVFSFKLGSFGSAVSYTVLYRGFESHQFFTHVQVCGSKNSLAAMLAAESSASGTLDVNLRNSLHSVDETCKWGIDLGFETKDRHQMKSKPEVSVSNKKD